MRYEYTTPVFDVNNRLANFDPSANNLVFAKPGGIEDRSTVKPDYNNFAPRVGIAYQLAAKTVVTERLRDLLYTGGCRISRLVSQSSVSDWNNGSAAIKSLQPHRQLPALGFPPVTAGSTLIGRFLNVSARPTNFPAAYSQQWNVSVQHQFGSYSVRSGLRWK